MRILFSAAGAALILAVGVNARAATVFSLDNSQTNNAGADIIGTFNDSAGTHWAVSGSPSGYYLSSLGGSPSATGLDFNNRMIATTDGTGLRFDLNGQPITSTGLPGSGGMSVRTYRGANPSGSVTITNAGAISAGIIDTHCDSNPGGNAGNITLGRPGQPIAGNIRVDALLADVRGYGSGNSTAAGGSITVYGVGDVTIQTPGGTAGNIDTHSYNAAGGPVNIQHRGAFVAGHISTRAHTDGNWVSESSANASFNGAFGGNAAGSFQVNSINTSHRLYSGSAGSISIQGYTGVTVAADLLATNDYSGVGGNISIGNLTAITGDIMINGAISATGTSKGALTMTAGGAITLASLDLGTVRSATLSSGHGILLTGTLANFPTSDPTSGLLDAPAGVTIVYNHKIPANAYLNGATYYLKSGGRMRSVARGTIVTMR